MSSEYKIMFQLDNFVWHNHTSQRWKNSLKSLIHFHFFFFENNSLVFLGCWKNIDVYVRLNYILFFIWAYLTRHVEWKTSDILMQVAAFLVLGILRIRCILWKEYECLRIHNKYIRVSTYELSSGVD